MAKRKLLVIAPKVPDPMEIRRDKRFYGMIEALSDSFEVHFVYIQSLFTKQDAITLMEKKGITVISLQSMKQMHKTENMMKHFLCEGRYEIILFNTYFTAKYYLPQISAYSPQSIVVIDVGKSQYISEIHVANEFKDSAKRISMLKNAETGKIKELAIYNNADVVIVDTAGDREILSRDIPSVDVRVIPGSEGNARDADELRRETVEVFSTIVQKAGAAGERTRMAIIESDGQNTVFSPEEQESLVKTGRMSFLPVEDIVRIRHDGVPLVSQYNHGLKALAGDYGVLVPDNVVLPEASIKRMRFCARSHPRNGIVVPLSNIDVSISLTMKTLGEFLEKHYVSDFGNWHICKRIPGQCIFLKRELIDAVGLFDERFLTLEYAFSDYCFRALQAGYICLRTHEAFAYYKNDIRVDNGQLHADRKSFYLKWCGAGREYLNRLS